MKFIRSILMLSVICLLTTPLASAQNGAEIYKYPDYLVIHSEWNPSQELLALFSSDSDAYCGADSIAIPYEITWIARPNGFWKYHDSGYYFMRVFQMTPGDLDTLETNYCLIWNDTGRMLADGMVYGVTNTGPQGWQYNLSGVLYDSVDLCEGDMVELNIVRKWKFLKNCDSNCEIPQVTKGPRLDCPE